MRRSKQGLTSVELFTGAGGLALGVASVGFSHRAVVEWNPEACDSLRENARRLDSMRTWPIHQGDVRDFDFSPYRDTIDLLAAGAPCQPFSLGGKHRGDADTRNLFPEVFRAVDEIQPRAVVIENVKGLLRTGFRDYFNYILLQLAFPDCRPKHEANWRGPFDRLLRLQKRPGSSRLTYNVDFQLVNAADFGVPQRRERVFVVALRSDLGRIWSRLRPTHTEDALFYAQYVSGEYWEEHGLTRRPPPARLAARIERLWSTGRPMFEERWRTVRDALRDLPAPKDRLAHPRILNHVGNPGARSYPGHTGSPYDLPAKTLKAGDHGVPGGENTLQLDDGSVRYFTVREAARLQTFPDEYRFQGSWGEAFRQLGNAVPVQLARAVVESVRASLDAKSNQVKVA